MGFDSIQPRRSHEKLDQAATASSLFATENDETVEEITEEILEDMTEAKTTEVTEIPLVNAEKASVKFLTYIVLLLFLAVLVIFSFAGFTKISNESSTYKIALNNDKTEIEAAIEKKDFALAMTMLDRINKDVTKTKYFAQSWGQDLQLWQMMSQKKSDLTMLESYLDAGHDILKMTPKYQEKITKIQSSDYLNTNGNIADLSQVMSNTNELFQLATTDLGDVRATLHAKNIDSSSILSKFDEAAALLSKGDSYLNQDLAWLVGADKIPKKYLIIFQNNSELVGGSGGSFGSFGVINTGDGKIRKIDFGINIWKLQADSLAKIRIAAPEDTIYNGVIGIKESGIYIDGKKALESISDYYEQTTGTTIDGVITIDVSTIAKLFDVTGSISMPAYGAVLDGSNLRTTLEKEVQQDYFTREGGKTENEPKKIIGEAMPIFMNRLMEGMKDSKKVGRIMEILSEALKEKGILLSLHKESIQSLIEKNNLEGQVADSSGSDYLYVNNSNLWITKSSLSVEETIDMSVKIDSEGSVVNQVAITRKHTGINTFPDGTNYNFVRVLLPSESQISSFVPLAGNFHIRDSALYRNGSEKYWIAPEIGKTKVAFWQTTNSGEVSQSVMSYLSGYKIKMKNEGFEYRINLQKQPGSLPDHIHLEVNYPVWYKPTNVINVSQAGNKFLLELDLKSDKEIVIDFERVY